MLLSKKHNFYGEVTVIKDDEGISQWILKDFIWEMPIVELFNEHIKPKTTVIDVGSHIGLHSIAMLKCLNNTGKLVSFEPQVFLHNILTKNLESRGSLTDISILNKAASDTFGNCYIEKLDYSTMKNPGGVTIKLESFNGADSVEKITIDSLSLENVSLIKIDAEGHEFSVIKGAEETILKNKPVIIVEILGGVYRCDATDEENEKINSVIQLLTNYGYSVNKLPECECDYLCIPN